jgi:ATP-binding cassette subfamily G (WHITE) protein 2 (SNQ2)
MLNEQVIYFNKWFRMYSRTAFPIANSLSDLPFSAVRIFVCNIIVYFMTGLHRPAGVFWTFYLISYINYLSMQGSSVPSGSASRTSIPPSAHLSPSFPTS